MDREDSEELTEANEQLELETKVKYVPFIISFFRLWWDCILDQDYDACTFFNEHSWNNRMI